ncbi:BCCT family transporter [Corynebacterium godavarianum]|uniref:BCCT family transporter n=1 Tax=Corynebacterium godavarianum TaxID=2054421 RepID=A0ABY3E756_9CORY|nr:MULTISPECIES: BCCT family transporter [Corynebacterium]MBL7285478.1 BCCT family transporter [Corynebacterium godavarianum]MCG7253459.1 BCCT family transporter [Corynebacterium hadale]MCG7255898.1 BCCT family transporter [Corynebacterium hadale]MCG7265698.1 BCCT family transporter [Corynebacterium hadale]TSJ75659.1 BCCT family transporter [Corynebacterium godavarianum]
MSQRETGLDPHDPGAEPRTADPQIENNSTDPAPSAAGELVSLLQADRAGERGNYQDPEEQIERQADAEDAPVDWGIIVPIAVIVVAMVAWGLLAPENFSNFADAAFGWVINNLGWAFVLGGTAFVVFVLVIACSNFGTIRLGSADERPEFKTTSWIAMMFAAGMGIGLMFYGASEPLAMYRDGVPGHEPHEVGTAMSQTMFHWTLHPWAVYAIMGLAIAYSTFRLGRKQLLSSAFIPLIGQKAADGPLGKLIDGFAIFATIFGTACSLGLGAMQISSGLEASGFVHDPSNGLIIGIVAVLTLAFLLSAMSGVSKGIQWLSNANMVIAALLAIFVFVFGPTVVQLNLLPTSVGTYLQNFFEMAGRTAESADGEAGDFLSSWTIFYWAWWISWSPFVGTFLARISRGRTIREFCLGVLLVPSGLSTVWFAIFGGTAIHMEQTGESIYADGSSEQQLFNLLHSLPGGVVMGVFALLLLATFFITSADSASTVMASMTQNGKSDAKPWIAAMWGLATAAVGLTLLISGGSDALNSLQSVTIVAATPFLLILIALMFAIVKDLSNDTIYLDKKEQERFSRQLAIERRMHRDQRELNARKAQVKRAFTGKRK